MTQTLVSIIIPCYNGERFVADAINSALAQTYARKEVIVVDDGSTDGSLKVIESFGHAIRWITGPNRGGCAARNRGIDLAAGDLVQFLDADDLLHPEKLTRQVPLALKFEESLVYSDYVTRGYKGEPFAGLQAPKQSSEDPVVFVLRTVGLATPTPLHWTSQLRLVGGFRDGLECAQERDLHLRLACHGIRFRHLPEVLVTVRRRSASVSSDYDRVVRQYPEIVNSAHDLLRATGGLTDERAEALARFLAKAGTYHLKKGDRGIASAYFAQARSIHERGAVPPTPQGHRAIVASVVGETLTDRLLAIKRRVMAQWHTR